MNDAIHVEVQIIELFTVGVCASCVDGDGDSIDLEGLFFDDWGYDLGVL